MLGRKKKNVDGSDAAQDTNEQNELDYIKEILENTQANIKKALQLLDEKEVDHEALVASLQEIKQVSSGVNAEDSSGNDRVVEGVFSGEKMIGADGTEFNVPANYASKSKLVEGDLLKLSITGNGSFIYKQIGPIERKQIVALLARNETTNQWYAVLDDNRWKLLTASVTYFHGQAGDQVVILIPKDGRSNWAAVENIIKS